MFAHRARPLLVRSRSRSNLVALAVLALGALALGACRRATPAPAEEATPMHATPAAGLPGGRGLAAEATPGIRLRLAEADPLAADAAAGGVRRADAAPLDDAAIAALLARLPALPEDAAATTDVRIRPGPPVPAVAGDTLPVAWPPPATAAPPAAAEDGPLAVARYQPEGDVPLAASVAVTFSGPFASLASNAALDAAEAPVRLAPQPPGRWRWVGTRTLVFEPEGGRLPMATEYAVTVPAGAVAADGRRLAEGATWTFRTPPPRVVDTWPYDDGPTTGLRPVVVLVFDQPVAAAEVAARVTLSASGARALRLATADELAADEDAARVAEGASPDRVVALVPEAELPRDAGVRVTIPAGLPGAEGPRTSAEARTIRFQTFGPLAVKEHDCDRPGRRLPIVGKARGCAPDGGWFVRFTNALDPSTVMADQWTVAPAVPGLRVQPHGDGVALAGAMAGRTEYTLTVPAGVGDLFGQTLGRPATLTFVTGDAPPVLYVPGGEGAPLTLDPFGPPALIVQVRGLDRLSVRLYRVSPEDYARIERLEYDDDGPVWAGGEAAFEGEIAVEGARDAYVAVPIDLTPALADGLGQVVAVVEPAERLPDDTRWRARRQLRWIQVTRLGLDVLSEGGGVTAWVTDLTDGSPVSGVTVRVSGGLEGTTDRDGLVRLAATPREPDGANRVVAARGGDAAFVSAWPSEPAGGDVLRWHLFSDRGLYQPGETARVKGYVRRWGRGVGGDVTAFDVAGAALRWRLVTSDGQDAAIGEAPVSQSGAFDVAVAVPEGAAVGGAELTFALTSPGLDRGLEDAAASIALNIAEFRRPAFELSVAAERPEALLGERAVVSAEARYYAGGALPGAAVDWSARASRTSYAPPGWEGFTFGEWTPWWDAWRGGPTPEMGGDAFESLSSTTDATGAHRLAVEVAGVTPPGPVSVLAEATVSDVDRQALSASAPLLVHPAAHYVGLRADALFVKSGASLALEAVVTDVAGAAVAGRAIAVVAERLEGRWTAEGFAETAEPAGGCDLTSGDAPVICALRFEAGGSYRVRATVFDDLGRANQSSLRIWVPGGEPVPMAEGLSEGRVELIPDRAAYAPGDTARILVRAPFAPAEALVSLRRSGIVSVRRLRMAEATTTLEVPIEDGYTPNVTVAVELVGVTARGPGAAAGADASSAPPPVPAFAAGAIDLAVPPVARTLDVRVSPAPDTVRPGGQTTVTVAVAGADGRPLPDAEVALVVVDEAVLALAGYRAPDPVADYYGLRDAGVSVWRSRAGIVVADLARADEGAIDQALASAGARADGRLERMFGLGDSAADYAPAAAGAAMEEAMSMDRSAALSAQSAADGVGGGGPPAPPVAERTNLEALAVFEPALRTGADGRVAVAVTLPDNVTRYRVTAVATDGAARFGVSSAGLTAALPLVVRPSAPRFLNTGDVFELPLVVQNRAAAARTVDVVVRAANLQLTAAAGYRVSVPADDRVEVRVPAAAARPGTAAFQAAVFDADDPTAADAQRVTLPVWTPATTEAFATYGTLDEGAARQPVLRPAEVYPGFGGLEVTLSSTALAELTDAYLYLRAYPYECAEQIASRVLATVALRDVLAAFDAPGLPPAVEVEASVAGDLEQLGRLQRGDGGFDWWPTAGRPSDPFITAHVVHALVRARDAGYQVDAGRLDRGLAWLRDVRAHLDEPTPRWSPEARRTAEALALYTRAVAGEADGARAAALAAEAGADAPVDLLGWLLGVTARDGAAADAAATIARGLANRVTETAATAQFAVAYDEVDGAVLLASDRRADAVVLDAWLVHAPESDLIPKLVRGLLDGRERGRWASTQESVWALLALEAYFRRFEADAPDFTARAWLDEGLAGEAGFRGRSADRRRLDIPLDALPASGAADLTLAKEGPGRLYYRLGLRYAPADLTLEADERGFAVTRSYEAVDDPADLRRTADGTLEVRAGARVRVRLTMTAPSRRYHVALVDPLPAGFEAENPDLATTARLAPPEREPADGDDARASFGAWWWGPWYDHAGFRDDRVEVFGDRVEPGVWSYTYIARATVPGTYLTPPLKAEEMYHPETYGRSATETVRVIDRR